MIRPYILNWIACRGSKGISINLDGNIKFGGSTVSNLDWVEKIDMSNQTNCYQMFSSCNRILRLPFFDMKNVTDMRQFCFYCSYLVEVPEYDTSNVMRMDTAFTGCSRLSTESLNNILSMCAKTNYETGYAKTLQAIGISRTQAETCQTLSNWDAFVEAGWSSGY